MLSVLKIDVLPPHATASWVVGITEEFSHADSCVCEDDYERPVTGRLQRYIPGSLLVEWVHVIGKGGVYLDDLTRLCVDVPGERVTLLGRPGLLVARLPVVAGERRGLARWA